MTGWSSEGIQTDPGASVLLADTGALPGGRRHTFTILCWANVGAEMIIQLRNAGNTDTVNSQVLSVTLGSLIIAFTVKLVPAISERLRIITRAAITGACQASIISS